jgi:hypothetical protein
LVDFVKDFNFEYLARVEAQDKDRRAWRSEMLALDTARETRIARKDSEGVSMDQKLYELKVERTRNLGNMTSALLMMASSMDALTRLCLLTCTTHYACASSSSCSWVVCSVCHVLNAHQIVK